jgi:sugar phosphate isomerase/epimerase
LTIREYCIKHIKRRNKMRFGLCTSPDNLELAGKLGFDYVEFSVASAAALSEEEFGALTKKMETSAIKAECFNVLFPGTIRLVGSDSSAGSIRGYLEKAFERVKALGGKTVVFGSGGCRAFPKGVPFKKSYRELVDAGKLIGKIAGDFGLTIAIEPLNRSETNCINSLIEGAMLEADVDSPHVGLLADLYHVLKEREPLEDILSVKELKHTHVAVLEGRAFPTTPDKDVKTFLEMLRSAGYSGTMSIEGSAENLEKDAAAALGVLRSL